MGPLRAAAYCGPAMRTPTVGGTASARSRGPPGAPEVPGGWDSCPNRRILKI